VDSAITPATVKATVVKKPNTFCMRTNAECIVTCTRYRLGREFGVAELRGVWELSNEVRLANTFTGVGAWTRVQPYDDCAKVGTLKTGRRALLMLSRIRTPEFEVLDHHKILKFSKLLLFYSVLS
jgi:hypothetical protein